MLPRKPHSVIAYAEGHTLALSTRSVSAMIALAKFRRHESSLPTQVNAPLKWDLTVLCMTALPTLRKERRKFNVRCRCAALTPVLNASLAQWGSELGEREEGATAKNCAIYTDPDQALDFIHRPVLIFSRVRFGTVHLHLQRRAAPEL